MLLDRALPAIYLKQVPYTMCQLATYDWVRAGCAPETQPCEPAAIECTHDAITIEVSPLGTGADWVCVVSCPCR